MRTTLVIDDDILAAAKHLAQRDRKTGGEAPQCPARGDCGAQATRNGVPLLPNRQSATPVTPEWVKQLRDELP